MHVMPRTIPLLVLLAIVPIASAQAPHDSWQTISTAHFRIHYPKSSAAWAEHVAATIESVRDTVVKEVGFAPPQTTDVMIGNPFATSNGATLPLLGTPRLVLWTEPPPPESQIGEYTSWIDLLTVHETAHLVHLLRPSRNERARLLEKILPLNPITLAAPRWVLEGYATVVEGRITGSGRPPGAMRAAILREWAVTGQFPTYAQLNGSSEFAAMSMAYLAGSAFLEWLEVRRGPGALRDLWARMTARQTRTFDTAFEGVFGESPRKLYGEFAASVTADAVSVLRASEPAQQGTVWQKTSHSTGDPAVSPDGKQIAIVIRERDKPSKLVIWSTDINAEEQKKFDEKIAKMIARDPEDVAPRANTPLPRKPVHTYTEPGGRDIQSPRWLADGSLLFATRQPDIDGFLHHDLFRWYPDSGRSTRVTQLADVFDADPYPDGKTAVAVRVRGGASQLVRVDLGTGTVSEVTPAAIDMVYSRPRVNADGRVLYTVHRTGRWHTVLLDGGEITTDAAAAEWDGRDIIATVFRSGFIDLARFRDGAEIPLTRMIGAAFDPAPSPDGRIFFMSLEPGGFVLRVLSSPAPVSPRPALTVSSPVVPPARATAVTFAEQPVTSRDYGFGRQEFATLTGANIAPSMHNLEVGARFGDIVGRLDSFALFSLANGDSPHGGTLASAWRGWPVEVAAQVYRVTELRTRETGGELRGTWDATYPLSSLNLSGGALFGDRASGFVRAFTSFRQAFGTTRLHEDVLVSGEAGNDRSHARVRTTAAVDFGSIGFAATYQRDRADEMSPIEVGGLISSIIPRSARGERVVDPALPFRSLTGTRYTGARLEANLGGITVFHQTHHAGDRIRLTGAEIALASPPIGLVKLPALALTLGGAHIYDDPLQGRNKFWIGMRWEP
jgi:hypothetical protein